VSSQGRGAVRNVAYMDSRILKTSSCWLWQGSLMKGQYPMGRFQSDGTSRTFFVRRVLWLEEGNVLERGQSLRPSCGQFLCVRPAHLCLAPARESPTLRHGEGRRGEKTSEYKTWTGIRKRCFNPKDRLYSYYGGRGVGMCESWRDSYEVFLRDVGRKPGPEFSLERIDNNRGYEPCAVRCSVQASACARALLGLDGRARTVVGCAGGLDVVHW